MLGRTMKPSYVPCDGGRRSAGAKTEKTSDCVIRAIAIALELPYAQVWDDLHAIGRKSFEYANNRRVYRSYLESKGWKWTTVLKRGVPRLPLNKSKLPKGRIIAHVRAGFQGHLAAVVNGVVYDTWNSSGCILHGYYSRFTPTRTRNSSKAKEQLARHTQKETKIN
jgi:hypothetical protein